MHGGWGTRKKIGWGLVVLGMVLLTVGVVIKSNFYAAGGASSYYVSPSGSDSNSGTQAKPFLTITKARDAIRAGGVTGVTVYLRGGVYPMTSPAALTAADSGQAGAPNIYQAYPGEKPILRGSVEVGQFTPYQGNIMVADLAAQGLSNITVPNLYMNGDLLTLARTPNYTPPNFSALDPYAGDFFSTTAATTANRLTFYYDKTQLNPNSWTPLTDAEVTINPSVNYKTDTRHITSVDTSAGTITLDRNTFYDITANNHFYIKNLFGQLDSPGEWYWDAVAKKLYLYPPRTLASTDRISVPLSFGLVTVTGASFLEFHGLTFEEMSSHAVGITNSHNIEVADCEIRNTGGNGILASGKIDNLTAKDNIIHDVGDNGIYAYLDTSYFKSLTSANVVISDNNIYRVGKLSENTNNAGINILNVGAIVTHNEVHDLPRIGIFYMGNDNIVENNVIYDVNKITQDSGGIYTGGVSWLNRGNIVRNNFVHDTGGYAHTSSGWRFNQGTWGIYLDGFSSGNTVYNNIVTRAGCSSYIIDGGSYNNIYNNIGAFANNTAEIYFTGIALTDANFTMLTTEVNNMQANGYDQAKYFARYPELSSMPTTFATTTMYSHNQFRQNIIYFPDHPSNDTFRVSWFVKGIGNVSNNNVFWNGGSAQPLQIYDSQAAANGGTNNHDSWALWKSFGYDTNSLLADPGFVNPSQDNFALAANSPVFSLGFTAIDQSKMGIEQLSTVVTDSSTTTPSWTNATITTGKTQTTKKSASTGGGSSTTTPSVTTDNGADSSSLTLPGSTSTSNQPWYTRFWNGVRHVWHSVIGFFRTVFTRGWKR